VAANRRITVSARSSIDWGPTLKEGGDRKVIGLGSGYTAKVTSYHNSDAMQFGLDGTYVECRISSPIVSVVRSLPVATFSFIKQ